MTVPLHSTAGAAKSVMMTSRPKMQVFNRLHQACSGTNTGNAEIWSKNFKQGNNNYTNPVIVYHDSSLFTASLRRVRMKANLQRLKEKELHVVHERR